MSTRIAEGWIQADFVNNFDRPVSFSILPKGKDAAGVTVFTGTSSDSVSWLLPGERYHFGWKITTGAVVEGQVQIGAFQVLNALEHIDDPNVILLSERRQKTYAPTYLFRNDGKKRATVSYLSKTYRSDGSATQPIGGSFVIEAGETLAHHVWDGVTSATVTVLYVQRVDFEK